MTDTATPDANPAPAPVPRPWAVVNFPTDVDMAEYADVETLHAQGVDDDAIARITKLTQLQSLTLDGTYGDEGVKHLASLTQLRSLTLRGAVNVTRAGYKQLGAGSGADVVELTLNGADQLTAKSLRACLRRFPNVKSLVIEGAAVGFDHLLFLPALAHLTTLRVVGGGDILGSGEGHLDRVSAVELVRRLESLEQVKLQWWAGPSMVSDDTLLAMLHARPGLTVNGTWFAPEVFDAAGSGADDRGSALGSGQPGTIELTADNFDDVVDRATLVLVQVWTSQENYCKAVTIGINATGASLDQMGSLLPGVTIGRIDAHTAGSLADRLRESDGIDVGDLAVFRGGRLVGRLSASSPTSIAAQLRPVL